MLKLNALHVSYGHIEVLKGISLEVGKGEIVALIGSNGAGKTTTLSAISGLVRATSGEIIWQGQNLRGRSVEQIVRAGLAHCPEGGASSPA